MKTGSTCVGRYGICFSPTSRLSLLTSEVRWVRPVIAVILLGAVAMGCARLKRSGESDVVFGRRDSARDQYYDAVKFNEATLVPREPKIRDMRLRRVIAAYQMVLDHFPDDPLYTPLAWASIGNCYSRMEEYRRAIRIFKEIEERYPNYPFVHAEAEWIIGSSLDKMGKSAEAKRHYRRCVDTFRHSENDQIKFYVALCEQRYLHPTIPTRRPKR